MDMTDNWHQILLMNTNKANELVALLKSEEGIKDVYIEHPIPLKPCIAPNDSEYSSQWHLHSASYPVSDIRAEQAWNINKGRSDVIIAVCDGGVDYNHRDLDPGDRSRVIAGYDSGNKDNNPMDDLPTNNSLSYGGHGTHVAGIIGAIANNTKQVSGVMWNCKIMPVKMVGNGSLTITYPFGSTNWDFSTTAFPSDVADAIDYAVNNGACVINLSYGFDSIGGLIDDVILRVPLLYKSILNAYNNNVVVVAAMGNEYNRGNPIQFPAAFREVIAVGNTTNNDPPSRSSSSSTGSHICVSAPGTHILSTVRGGGTDYNTGTSMAAPVVSGVAGLIISQGKDRNFNLTNDDVRHIIELTADDVTSTGIGFDNETGYGKVNAYNALALINTPNEVYHGNMTGGTATKLSTMDKWSWVGGKWNLSTGVYLNVDEYQITQHITFDVPYCSIPKVWMRERESKCLSFAKPNLGYPYCEITNITTTGFDIRYAAYYIRYDISNQSVNKWVPANLGSTNVAYTVVGQPNLAGVGGPLSGPSAVCSSGSTFTVNNVPSGATVSWTCSSNISFDHQTGTPKTFKPNGTGNGTIQAILITNCGNVPLPAKTVSVGLPNTPGIDGDTYLGCSQYLYTESIHNPVTWSVIGPLQISGTNYGYKCIVKGTGSGVGWIRATATNDCGSVMSEIRVDVVCGHSLAVSSNLGDGQTVVSIESADELGSERLSESAKSVSGVTVFDETIPWDLEVYTQNQLLKDKKTKQIGRSTTINTSGWPEGVYIIRVVYNGDILTGKLVVKH